MTGGLLVVSALSLYLSGLFNEAYVAWGVAFVATVLAADAFATSVLQRTVRLASEDLASLAAGALLSAAAPVTGGGLAPLLTVSGAAAFAFATRRLLRGNARDLIVAAAGAPIVVLGVAAGLSLPFAASDAWAFGLLAADIWPAAVAVQAVRQRRAEAALGRQLVHAETHLARREYAQSVRDYDRAIAVGKAAPDAEMPWYGKGATLIQMGRYEEGLRAIDKALDLNPRNEVAWLNKGNALTKMGRLLDALRCFNAAIKVNPAYEVAWNNKGNALARLDHLAEALDCYERALEIDPGYRGAWINKGYVLTKLGRYDEATRCADRALHLDERVRTGAA